MPPPPPDRRAANLPADLVKIKEVRRLEEQDPSRPRTRRQVVARLPMEVAEPFVAECIERGETMPEGAERIVRTYFEGQQNGAYLTLGKFPLSVLDKLCAATGESRDGIIRDLLTEYGLRKLKDIKDALGTPGSEKVTA